MYTLLVENQEFITDHEQVIADVISQLASEHSPVSSKWTPIFHESYAFGFSVTVHTDTWEDEDYYNKSAIAAWENLLDCSLDDDVALWERLQKLLDIKVITVA
ncbi:hypothetical protein BAMA_04860 [Bacillus manliponensis]|uniref:Uncharacterized protein n=1 Tax=Bacillus manliponensis TaxID=574376 RepID=A0A073JWF6_9BACI|nr:hypothetical protein [Bacillus manliponensis]KEK18586.1 hypothetical protein BAMA_04860 [Bacillus manliponensis]